MLKNNIIGNNIFIVYCYNLNINQDDVTNLLGYKQETNSSLSLNNLLEFKIEKQGMDLRIGPNTFKSFGSTYNNIGTLTIPSKILYIGESAFEDSKFNKLIFDSGVNTLSIKNRAFKNLINIDQLSIPTRKINVGKEAFFNFINCKKLIFKSSFGSTQLLSIGPKSFENFSLSHQNIGSLNIPSRIDLIDTCAFKNSKFGSLNFEDSNIVLKINDEAFYNVGKDTKN